MNPRDPRFLQILFLGALLLAGALLYDFTLRPEQVLLDFAGGLAAQWCHLRRLNLRHRGYASAAITCLGTSVLIRADNLWVHPLAAALAVSSKFLLRVRGKHLFNPGNFGILAALLFFPGAWVSPGQWGRDTALLGWMLVLGSVVAGRAMRSDASWCFLTAYLGASALRCGFLGYEAEVFLHLLKNGSLLLFAFFMISDPMTLPDHPHARRAHAALVGLFAFVWQFVLFFQYAPLWGLFLLAPLVPAWDSAFRCQRFDWTATQGGNHEKHREIRLGGAGGSGALPPLARGPRLLRILCRESGCEAFQ